MKPSERPPLKHKKGIQIIQPSHQNSAKGLEWKDSATGSLHSTNRSRGISISRQSGITVDKIYDAKHFLPPKSPQTQKKILEGTSSKALTSVRSLKLISMFGDSNVQGCRENEGQAIKKEEVDVSEFKVEMGGLQNRCNSPILKLASTQEHNQMLNTKSEQRHIPNILKF